MKQFIKFTIRCIIIVVIIVIMSTILGVDNAYHLTMALVWIKILEDELKRKTI
jgi:hypothetical protein